MFTKKIVVLFSGEGGNFKNLIETLHQKIFAQTRYEIVGSICNNKDANGLKIAHAFNIPCEILEHKKFKNREEFDTVLVKKINSFKADLTVLAGFMRILTPIFTDNIKAINLHPSLLPLFKGTNAIERSFYSDMKVAGVSVHLVSSELDGGEIISQKCFQKDEDMSFDDFKKNIKEIEFEILPKAVMKILKD